MKKRALIFGTGKGGSNAYKFYKSDYEIIGFLDNDKTKTGARFKGKPIYAPTNTPSIEHDLIIIASMFSLEMAKQLVYELEVPEETILVCHPEILNGVIFWGKKAKNVLMVSVMMFVALIILCIMA